MRNLHCREDAGTVSYPRVNQTVTSLRFRDRPIARYRGACWLPEPRGQRRATAAGS